MQSSLTLEDFDFVEDSILRRVLAYWLDIRGSEKMPRRSKLDPIDMPWALSKIWLVKRESDNDRFCYILAGEDVQETYQMSLKGKCLEDIFSEEVTDLLNNKFGRVCDDPAIAHDAGPIYTRTDRSGYGERLHFPLSDDQGNPAFVLGCTSYIWDKIPQPGAERALAPTRFINL